MFGYLGQLRNLNHSSSVTKFDTCAIASFWLFPFLTFPYLSHAPPQPVTPSQTNWHEALSSASDYSAHGTPVNVSDMTRQVICASVCFCMHVHMLL